MKFDQKQIFVLQDTTINTVPVCILVQQFFKLEKSIEHNGSYQSMFLCERCLETTMNKPLI